MIKELDFTAIDLQVVKAHLRLEQLKADFVVKPEAEIVRVSMPCARCDNEMRIMSHLYQSAQMAQLSGVGCAALAHQRELARTHGPSFGFGV